MSGAQSSLLEGISDNDLDCSSSSSQEGSTENLTLKPSVARRRASLQEIENVYITVSLPFFFFFSEDEMTRYAVVQRTDVSLLFVCLLGFSRKCWRPWGKKNITIDGDIMIMTLNNICFLEIQRVPCWQFHGV